MRFKILVQALVVVLVTVAISPAQGIAQGPDRPASGSHEERVQGIYAVLFKDIALKEDEQLQAMRLISECRRAQVALVSSGKATRDTLAALQLQRDNGLRALIDESADRARFDVRAKRMMPKG